tara:strand:- start:1315 stop:1974 length:660 start_codon:yes stop_codon:yes gene_type:complete
MPLIVLCGIDGSGKKTQLDLLQERLAKEGKDVEVVDFPRYGEKSASLVEEYLNGKFGTAEEVGPYRASIFFAVDRYAASFQMKEWLEQGKVVLANRYVSASKGHQTAQIESEEERKNYLSWLDELEYGTFSIPKEDKVILLDLPPELSQQQVDKKGKRRYTEGRDIHEADAEHLRRAATAYLFVAKREGWSIVPVANEGNIRKREAIHGDIYEEVQKVL